MSARKSPSTTKVEAPVAPPMPPPTEEEQAQSRRVTATLQEACVVLHQRNLDSAVLLAQQAARGRGPLVDHFAELGRRFGHTLDTPPPRPKLRVIKGGADRLTGASVRARQPT
jgi:hypothetical protein